jgi:hypothetical protein
VSTSETFLGGADLLTSFAVAAFATLLGASEMNDDEAESEELYADSAALDAMDGGPILAERCGAWGEALFLLHVIHGWIIFCCSVHPVLIMHRIKPTLPECDRESLNDMFTLPSGQQQPESSAHPILYVARSCPHSQSIVQLSKECGVMLNRWCVDDYQGLPSWDLPGVPAIETPDGDVYCGDAAFSYVLNASMTPPGPQTDSERMPPPRARPPQPQATGPQQADSQEDESSSLADNMALRQQEQSQLLQGTSEPEIDNRAVMAAMEARMQRRSQQQQTKNK